MTAVENAKRPWTVQDYERLMALKEDNQIRDNLIDSIENNRPPRLWTKEQFTQHFQISKKIEYAWRKAGLIPHIQIGSKIFYDLSDVLEFQNKNKTIIHHKAK